jgi:hypothetical protein
MRMNAKNLLAAVCVVVAACSSDKSKETKAAGSAGSASPKSDVAAPASYVGLRYDPLPPGVTYESGSVILGKDGKPTQYVLSYVGTPKGMKIWLDSILPEDGAIHRRIVRAEMDDPPIRPVDRRVIGTCGVYGKFEGDIIAVVKEVPGRKYTTVYRAWRANPAAARFDSISTQGVECEDAEIPPEPARKKK